jgi:hypothetical protein
MRRQLRDEAARPVSGRLRDLSHRLRPPDPAPAPQFRTGAACSVASGEEGDIDPAHTLSPCILTAAVALGVLASSALALYP